MAKWSYPFGRFCYGIFLILKNVDNTIVELNHNDCRYIYSHKLIIHTMHWLKSHPIKRYQIFGRWSGMIFFPEFSFFRAQYQLIRYVWKESKSVPLVKNYYCLPFWWVFLLEFTIFMYVLSRDFSFGLLFFTVHCFDTPKNWRLNDIFDERRSHTPFLNYCRP